MVKEIVHDVIFLSQKSVPATKADLQVGKDLMDTLAYHRSHCVGLAANMIGVKKNVICVSMGMINVAMFNPVIVAKSLPFETQEGCLSLEGERKTTRYTEIEVEYTNMAWKKVRQKFRGFTAQAIQHECDHLQGIII